MQINIDCLRDVLGYCIENIDYEPYEDSWITKQVGLDDLYQAEKLVKHYSRKDIMRSILKLEECCFIKFTTKTPPDKPYIDSCLIEDITVRGYKFYESTKEPNIWDKTKSVIEKVGNHTLGFIENVAHDIAVETAKEAIAVAMTARL